MPNGLSTARRGIGFGPLSTLTSGILSESLIIIAPPFLSIENSQALLEIIDLSPGVNISEIAEPLCIDGQAELLQIINNSEGVSISDG